MFIQLRSKADKKAVEKLLGHQAAPEDFRVQLTGSCTVFKPNGDRLITLVREGISEETKARAYPFLHALKKHVSRNRGKYSGAERYHKLKEDGTASNTNYAVPVRSAIVGSFDRYPRVPYCRQTALSTEDPEGWGDTFPMIQEVAAIFKEHEPGRYDVQLQAAKKTHPSYVIPGTPFTTLTVNNSVAGGYHRDAGDYAPGFGVIAVLRKGHYRGCHLGFPGFGVSVDLQDRDVILFDPHEVHGNTPFYDTVGEETEDWERISIVFYFREKMLECLSPAEELERAKMRGQLIDDGDL